MANEVQKPRFEPAKVTLVFSYKERQNLEGFLERHGNCIDSELTVETSHGSGIGVSTKVSCQCGGSQDVTDYGIW